MERKRSRSPRRILKNQNGQEEFNILNGKKYSERYFTILKQRQNLPVFEAKQKIIKLVENNQVIILEGETGCGKTTQIPQYILIDLLLKKQGIKRKAIACTQPRRVAAMSVAKRVSEEMDVKLGEEVGYSIRFEDCSSGLTLIKYLTDGMLLREAITDHLLSQYAVIILDEAHERTLQTDILFGFLKVVLKKRSDLKVIVMSATLDAQKFQSYFEGSPLIQIPGRLHQVEILHTQKAEKDYIEATIRTVLQIHCHEEEGDILVFLTGEEEIEGTCDSIRDSVARYGDKVQQLTVLPLYSQLPPKQQARIFQNFKGRKCIVATNIAETSLTIEGVVYVVDCGFVKQNVYDPRTRVQSLLICPISQASAKQRAGRAGRTKAGKCYRLYTQQTYQELKPSSYPEILRSNLSSIILNLKALGIDDLVHFDFIDPPAPETVMRALELLNLLGAFDDQGNLTEIGQQMAQFPVEPEMAKLLIVSSKHRCSNECLSLVAMLSLQQNCFLRPKDNEILADQARQNFSHVYGDHLTLLNVFHVYLQEDEQDSWCHENFINPRAMKMAVQIREQLQGIMMKLNLELCSLPPDHPDYYERIIQCLLQGYFLQTAVQHKNNVYITLKEEKPVFIHPSCVLEHTPSYVLYQEFVFTKKNYIRTVSSVSKDQIKQIAPWLLKNQQSETTVMQKKTENNGKNKQKKGNQHKSRQS